MLMLVVFFCADVGVEVGVGAAVAVVGGAFVEIAAALDDVTR